MMEPVDEEEGDFFMGDPDLDEGGGGKSAAELSGGGGGNSGDCGATTPPGCHFGLALTAGTEGAALEEEAAFPGNWLTICLTSEEVAAAMETEVEEADGEMERFFDDRLCCLGRVGGGWFGEWPVEKLCCFLTGPWRPFCGVGDTGESATGKDVGPDGFGAV